MYKTLYCVIWGVEYCSIGWLEGDVPCTSPSSLAHHASSYTAYTFDVVAPSLIDGGKSRAVHCSAAQRASPTAAGSLPCSSASSSRALPPLLVLKMFSQLLQSLDNLM